MRESGAIHNARPSETGQALNGNVHVSDMVLHRVQCTLVVPGALAQPVTDRCSNLFHHELDGLLSNVIEQLRLDRSAPITVQRLVVDLGALNVAHFEFEMMERLHKELEHELRRIMTLEAWPGFALTPSVTSEPAADLRSKPSDLGQPVDTEYISRLLLDPRRAAEKFAMPLLSEDALDVWIFEQLQTGPAQFLASLARCCVEERTLRPLFALLRPLTRDTLTKCLLRGVPIKGIGTVGMSQQALYLAALLYFLYHLNEPLPDQRGSGVFPFVQPDKHESWLLALFDNDAVHHASPALKKQLKALWHQAEIARRLKLHFSDLDYRRIRASFEVTQPALTQRGRNAREPWSNGGILQESALTVTNAGIVLLWPLLPDLFTALGLWDRDRFISEEGAMLAAGWLDILVWDDDIPDSSRLELNNVLCGRAPDIGLLWLPPDHRQRELLIAWFENLSEKLSGVAQLNSEDIRALFLRRRGSLIVTELSSTPRLEVEAHASDALLRLWPWPINTVLLPWMNRPLTVQWG